MGQTLPGKTIPSEETAPNFPMALEKRTITFLGKEYTEEKEAHKSWNNIKIWTLNFSPSIPLEYLKENGKFISFSSEMYAEMKKSLETKNISEAITLFSNSSFSQSYGNGKTGELPKTEWQIKLEANEIKYNYSYTCSEPMYGEDSIGRIQVSLTEDIPADLQQEPKSYEIKVSYEEKEYAVQINEIETENGHLGRQLISAPPIPLRWLENTDIFTDFQQFAEEFRSKIKEENHPPGSVFIKRCCCTSDEAMMFEKETAYYLEIEVVVNGTTYTYSVVSS